MRYSIIRLIAASAACFALAQGAQACNGDQILFEDKFEFADPGWGTTGDQFKIENGKLLLRAPQNAGTWVVNKAFVFDSADICYTVVLSDTSSDPTASYGGLVFWMTDIQTFFALATSSNGYFKVSRRISNQWAADPIGWTKTDTLKEGPNAANKVRVRLDGQLITVEINDQKVTQFRAQKPSQPTPIGFMGFSPASSADGWTFSDLKVTNVVKDAK